MVLTKLRKVSSYRFNKYLFYKVLLFIISSYCLKNRPVYKVLIIIFTKYDRIM